jgi:hypothetical protein
VTYYKSIKKIPSRKHFYESKYFDITSGLRKAGGGGICGPGERLLTPEERLCFIDLIIH